MTEKNFEMVKMIIVDYIEGVKDYEDLKKALINMSDLTKLRNYVKSKLDNKINGLLIYESKITDLANLKEEL